MYVSSTFKNYSLLQEQFTFIHDAVLESVTCGDTQISTGDLRSAIHMMQQRNSDTNKTAFEVQFEVRNFSSYAMYMYTHLS